MIGVIPNNLVDIFLKFSIQISVYSPKIVLVPYNIHGQNVQTDFDTLSFSTDGTVLRTLYEIACPTQKARFVLMSIM